MEWMVWTPSVAIFFSVIILALVGMTIWGIKSPSVPRKGFLPMRTARGDRFFIGILGSAFINLAWLGFTDLTQWIGLGLSLIFMFVIARWG